MTDWPAVIRQDGDDELIVIGSDAEWRRDAAQHLYGLRSGSTLIDSAGRIFRLAQTRDGAIQAADTGKTVSLEDFIRLVRIHASTSHRCCIEKISFRTVAEGIQLVASMNEQD